MRQKGVSLLTSREGRQYGALDSAQEKKHVTLWGPLYFPNFQPSDVSAAAAD